MNYIYLSFTIICFLTSCSKDKTIPYKLIYQKQIGSTDKWEEGLSILESVNHEYIICSSSGIGIRTDKLNLNGNIIWSRNYPHSHTENVSKIIQNTSSTYLIIGESVIITNPEYSEEQVGLLIMEINDNGDTLWSKRNIFNGDRVSYDISVRDAVKLSDGSIIVCGNLGNNGVLIKISSNGDIIWSRKLGFDNRYIIYKSVIETYDNKFMIAGKLVGPGGAETDDALLIKTDAEGDTIWTKTYGYIEVYYNNYNISNANSIIETENKDYLICGQIGGCQKYPDIFIFKTDENGNVIWHNIYGSKDYDEGISIISSGNNEFIALGNSVISGQNWQVYLLKINEKGDIIWQDFFGENTLEMGNAICNTSEGDILVCGRKKVSDNNFDTYLLKINPN